jgi:molybdopterin synthase catalytic subunit
VIEIVKEQIDIDSIRSSVESEDCGAINVFIGTTRRMTKGRETLKLEYDCYVPMAISELEKLRKQAMEKWPLHACSIVHRIGVVEKSQASVVVAVSSPHRVDAFEASQWIMDTLKKVVPIWKKEVWADGETEWVHPEPNAE